jgi:membrane protein YqaA with SNARE-associated domain
MRAMDAWIAPMLAFLALPQYGLPALFVVALVSATLLPMGSEPVLFGLVKQAPALFWPAVLVATAGNTLGGAISWWIGRGAERAYDAIAREPHAAHPRALRWLERFGPKACLLSWLPVVGDPVCAVAGWLRLPFWPCVGYMALGKFARYVVTAGALLWAFPGRAG